jgi:hypothetical protein
MQFKVQLYYTVMDEDYDIRHISGVAGKKVWLRLTYLCM